MNVGNPTRPFTVPLVIVAKALFTEGIVPTHPPEGEKSKEGLVFGVGTY
jgi:hypothetical protein